MKVLSDIDGTLLRFGGQKVAPSVKVALEGLYLNGIQVHLVTSRTIATTQDLINDMSIGHQLLVTDSGATVAYADTFEIVWRQWLDGKLVYELSSLLVAYAVIFCCTLEHNPLTQESAKKMIARGEHGFVDVPSIFVVHTQDSAQLIRAVLVQFKTIRIHTEPYEGGPLYGTQITCKGVDKESGVRRLLAISGDYSGGILAIGDGSNDLPLFKTADIKVAMGSSPDVLKEQADFVTDTVECDGFIQAMYKYGLL